MVVKVSVMSCAMILSAVCASFSDDMRSAAEKALSGMEPISDMFVTEKMEETVSTYETSKPAEADLRPEDFDARILYKRTQGGDEGRAFTSTVDSVKHRPNVEPSLDAMDLANESVKTAEDTVGGLFTQSGGGSCEAEYVGGAQPGTNLCTSILGRRFGSCTETRGIDVDRRDNWFCKQQTAKYRKVCEKPVLWSCKGSSGPYCRSQNFAVSGIGKTTLTQAGITAQRAFSYNGSLSNSCSVHTKTFNVTVGANFDPSFLVLRELRLEGVGQIFVDNDLVWSSHSNATGALRVAELDCGKRCSRTTVFSGNTAIETCGSTGRTGNSGNIAPALNKPNWTSIFDSRSGNYHATGVSKTLTIKVVSAGTGTSPISGNVAVRGTCCTAMRGVPQC